ncbi:hypothetical protein RND71_039682 [Anisodus tanguticus]|uniref:Uncharacterized protein n=1 Tax=Anisodus tanguticus TaxID=243964 RepID=A0AAE1QXA4_9SOLA|nr:hypothetical protein RND71_039682 [Anisodus tanguticus]
MYISNDLQKFCVLEYSGCKQKKSTKHRRQFQCTKCNRQIQLVPRGSTTTYISGELAENMLSITADQINDTTFVKEPKKVKPLSISEVEMEETSHAHDYNSELPLISLKKMNFSLQAIRMAYNMSEYEDGMPSGDNHFQATYNKEPYNWGKFIDTIFPSRKEV